MTYEPIFSCIMHWILIFMIYFCIFIAHMSWVTILILLLTTLVWILAIYVPEKTMV